jgi:hypothetical protein
MIVSYNQENMFYKQQDTTDKKAIDTLSNIISEKLPNIFSPKGLYYNGDFLLSFHHALCLLYVII